MYIGIAGKYFLNSLRNSDIYLNKKDHIYKLKSKPSIQFTSVTTFVDGFLKNLIQKNPQKN